MKKRLISLTLVLAMCLALLAGCGGSTAANPADKPQAAAPADAPQEVVTLKIGYGIADTTTLGKAVQTWADRVTEETNGRYKFEIYPSGQLGALNEMIEAVDLGQLDITMNDSGQLCSIVPETNLLSMPMLIKDYEGWKNLTSGEIGDQLIADVAETTNITVLGWIFNGFREVICKNEVTSLESCTDVIIRSPDAEAYVQTLSRLNFTPTALPFAEVYSALQTGVVQATETTYEQFVVNSYYEEAKHMVETNHLVATMGMFFNTKVWESIPAEDQAIMLRINDEVFGECSDAIYGEAEGYKKQLMEEHGCTLYCYTDAEQAELLVRFEDFWKEYAAANNCTDLLEKALEIR